MRNSLGRTRGHNLIDMTGERVFISLAHMYNVLQGGRVWAFSFVLYIYDCFRSWLSIFHNRCSRFLVPSIYLCERTRSVHPCNRALRSWLDSGQDCGSGSGGVVEVKVAQANETEKAAGFAVIGIVCLLLVGAVFLFFTSQFCHLAFMGQQIFPHVASSPISSGHGSGRFGVTNYIQATNGILYGIVKAVVITECALIDNRRVIQFKHGYSVASQNTNNRNIHIVPQSRWPELIFLERDRYGQKNFVVRNRLNGDFNVTMDTQSINFPLIAKPNMEFLVIRANALGDDICSQVSSVSATYYFSIKLINTIRGQPKEYVYQKQSSRSDGYDRVDDFSHVGVLCSHL